MVKFGKREIAKENFYAVKKPIKDWDVNVDNLFQVFDCILISRHKTISFDNA